MKPERATPLQRYLLERLTECIRDYIKATMPEGARHRKTTFLVLGDRFKIDDVSCRFVTPSKKHNEP